MVVDGRGRRQRRSQRREGGFASELCKDSQHKSSTPLPLDEVRRIYVAFGEHPAAGGSYMFFWSLWQFAWPCGVSLALWVASGLHVAPWASILTHMGYSWEAFWHFGETSGFISAPLGSLWVPLGSMLVPCVLLGVALHPLSHFCGK